MTNSASTSTTDTIRGYAQTAATKQSDEAPMIVTRLSGWIDMGEPRTTAPSWIVRTRMSAPAR